MKIVFLINNYAPHQMVSIRVIITQYNCKVHAFSFDGLSEDSNCDSFKKQVSEICNKSHEVLMQYANQGALVTNMFSAEVWNKTMTDIENYRK
jgi:hypothetical protein